MAAPRRVIFAGCLTVLVAGCVIQSPFPAGNASALDSRRLDDQRLQTFIARNGTPDPTPTWDLRPVPEGLRAAGRRRRGRHLMEEQRGDPRTRVLRAGLISFGGSTVDCTVRNVSETGAQVEVQSPDGIPDRFALLIKSEGVRYGCRVVWVRGKRIGLRFERRHEPPIGEAGK